MISALCALLLVAGGCDFIRVIAGRPTSEEIDAKREFVEQQELRKRQMADSAALAKKMEEEARLHEIAADSATLRLKESNRMIPVSRIGSLDRTAMDRSYYVMIGSFSSSVNAQSLVEKASEAGFDAVIIPYYNGRSAVALDPSDDIVLAEQSLNKALQYPFCPADAWVLVNE